MGKLELAKKYSLLALDVIPADAQLLFNMGVISVQLGLVKEAISYYQLCLQVSPDNIEAHTNLGAAFLEIKDKQSASHHLREVVRLRPDDVAVKHTLAIISGEQPMHAAPATYIQTLFDSYADHYDKHVQETLKYQVPGLIHDMLQTSGMIENKKLSILDLGCGTGLCGVELAPYAETITGVDLSANMLEIATARKCYTTLVKSDIIDFLNKDKEKYDLIVAGDTVVYFADLDELFGKVHEHLNVNGMFAFNVEKSTSDDILPAAGRFAHRPDYVLKLAGDNHFTVLLSKEVVLRQQETNPVTGILYLLR
jgi:predicted TPR repeat methyltransferase